jgi:hypothetical protein
MELFVKNRHITIDYVNLSAKVYTIIYNNIHPNTYHFHNLTIFYIIHNKDVDTNDNFY